jgi:hypothetical protein
VILECDTGFVSLVSVYWVKVTSVLFSKKGQFFWRYPTKRICAIFTFAELVMFKFALFEIES